MILINFSHPLTEQHVRDLEQLAGEKVSEVRDFSVHFDQETTFSSQAVELVERVGLSPAAWQTERLLINPPSHSLVALALLAELHGRMGYFPAVVRLKPAPDTLPPRFEVAEILNLQAARNAARAGRAR